ncbi:VVA0879 family protein [Paenibacillus sp. 8b26]|uniref:VVA0879 family protein n=1 Tax=Paenibacillus sp. 8b26 TaxID=3424133 RepID=UPI003D645FCE
MIKQTLEEWRTEAIELFGDKASEWKFVCPACSGVQSPKDFVDAGLEKDQAANTSYQRCIGRIDKSKGCNWAAYGLMGTLGKGRLILTPEGNEVEVFDFAAPQGGDKQ